MHALTLDTAPQCTNPEPWFARAEKTFFGHIESVAILRRLDSVLQESVPGVAFLSSHEAFKTLVARGLDERVRTLIAKPLDFCDPVESCGGRDVLPVLVGGPSWRCWCWKVSVTTLSRAHHPQIAWMTVAAALAIGVGTPRLGAALAKRRFLRRVRSQAEAAARETFETCVAETAAALDARTVEEAIDRMTAKVVPRPLQRLVLKDKRARG